MLAQEGILVADTGAKRSSNLVRSGIQWRVHADPHEKELDMGSEGGRRGRGLRRRGFRGVERFLLTRRKDEQENGDKKNIGRIPYQKAEK